MRLFIAFPLTKEIEDLLGRIILDLKQKRGRVKWVKCKNIHLTAKFLGDTSDDKIVDIKEAINHVAEKHIPANCKIDRLGAFPNLKRLRVIWAGLRGEIEKLERISLDIESEMEKLGFEKENRKFKPHLTLGRVKDNSDLWDLTSYIKDYQMNPEKLVFDRVVLFKSTLTPYGPIYDRLHEVRFP